MDFLDIPDEILAQRYPGQDIGLLKEAYRQAQAVKSGQAEKSAKPVTETIKTDPGTGEQTVTISGSPHDLSPANPLTPTVVSPVAPTAPVVSARPQMVAPQQPVQPVNPAEAYNQYTQQQESGANPNIGYHNPQQSTAYGAYGITQPQYQEIQKQNPQFAGRDIASLSPEEQAQANATSHDVYANQLKAKGVEPTEENIRLAHFLGAGGAHQFLNNGAISPQAAAANGGEDKARQIALARLNGPVNPNQAPPMIAGNASSDVGLTPTEQAVSQMNKKPSVDQVASDAIVAAGNNPTKLYALAGNEDFPENFRNIARDMALQHDKFASKKTEVLGNFEDAANGNVTAANKMLKSLRSPGEEGSLTKAVLLGLIGARSLAKEEFQKYSGQFYTTSKAQLGDQSYTIQSDPKGAIVKAYDVKGIPVSDEKLAELNARGVPQGTHAYGFTGESAIVPGTNQEVRQRTNSITGNVEYVYVNGPEAGKVYSGAEVPIPKSVSTSQYKTNQKVVAAYQEKFGKDALGALAQMQKDRGPMTRDEQDAFLNSYGFQSGPPGVGGVGSTGTTQTQPGQQQQPLRPVAPGQQQPGAAPAQPNQAPVNGPAVPGQPQTQPQVAGAPGTPGSSQTSLQNRAVIDQIGQMRPRGTNEPESAYAAYKKTYEKTASELAEGQAKVQLNLPQYVSTADQILKNIDQVTYQTNKDGSIIYDKDGNPKVSEGLKSNVGVPGITGILNIPGTEARDWRAKYKNLEAKQFMLQFEKLRGAGAISDKEGQTATAALAALQDTGISEEAFLKNAQELRDLIKVGTNRQIMLSGKEPDPRYFLGDPKQSKEAYNWAKNNPNDPRTPDVLEKIGLR